MNLQEKIQNNTWDSVEVFLKVLQKQKEGKWNWYKNSKCKYVELRVDMRNAGCIIKDRNGNRISPEDLEYQIET